MVVPGGICLLTLLCGKLQRQIKLVSSTGCLNCNVSTVNMSEVTVSTDNLSLVLA